MLRGYGDDGEVHRRAREADHAGPEIGRDPRHLGVAVDEVDVHTPAPQGQGDGRTDQTGSDHCGTAHQRLLHSKGRYSGSL